MIEIRSGRSKAVIDPTGAYLQSLVLNNREILMESTDGKQTHGGMAILIPFANRVRNAEYSYNGIKYRLPANDGRNSIHGLTRGVEWNILHNNGNSREAELEFSLESKSYPSVARILAKYEITDDSLTASFSLFNLGSRPVPLVIGAHPYFRISGKWNIHHTEDVRKLNYVDEYFPDGTFTEADFNSSGDLSSESFDNCYLGGGVLELSSEYGKIKLERNNMPYFVLYNGKYSRGESVAIEPMTGAPDAFNNGMGVTEVEPAGEFSCGFNISI